MMDSNTLMELRRLVVVIEDMKNSLNPMDRLPYQAALERLNEITEYLNQIIIRG